MIRENYIEVFTRSSESRCRISVDTPKEDQIHVI